jgi:hypothetical protein
VHCQLSQRPIWLETYRHAPYRRKTVPWLYRSGD